jgi:hypothetical protein
MISIVTIVLIYLSVANAFKPSLRPIRLRTSLKYMTSTLEQISTNLVLADEVWRTLDKFYLTSLIFNDF